MKPLTTSEIQAMVENGQTEDRSLGFKGELPGHSDSEKLKFIEDASSFANAGGGHIIYGIAEKRDASGQPTGVAGEVVGVEIESVEKATLRLDQLLQVGVSPRIQGYRLYAVGQFKRGPVIALYVPRSWNGPHMVTLQGKQRFYRGTAPASTGWKSMRFAPRLSAPRPQPNESPVSVMSAWGELSLARRRRA